MLARSLVGTGDEICRDMFYDGHPRAEPGAIVCRVAPSFLRFGSFELPASRGEVDLLRQLAEFCIWRDFPELLPEPAGTALAALRGQGRSEEHTSELQSLMRISYAVFCLKKKNKTSPTPTHNHTP